MRARRAGFPPALHFLPGFVPGAALAGAHARPCLAAQQLPHRVCPPGAVTPLSADATRRAVLSDAALRKAYDAATEYDVEAMDIAEYLARFQYLILTVSGLGATGWGDAEAPEPLPLAAVAAGAWRP